MTWDEIKAWLLANGWSLHEPPNSNRTPESAQFSLDCAAGRVMCRDTEDGITWIVHMMKRNIRVVTRTPSRGVERVITVHPHMIRMKDGMPRGMGLWLPSHSPHHGGRNT